jgi:hypothetical protein
LTWTPSAAWLWLTIAAVVAVPLVPLTVRPTTLAAVGVIVLAAVLAGIWKIKLPEAGAAW